MTSVRVTSVVNAANDLGESVFWAPDTQVVYWIDGTVPAIHRFDYARKGHTVHVLALEPPLGMIARTTEPGLIALSYWHGIGILDMADQRLTAIADPERGRSGVVYNDGKIDPHQRLWVGTCDFREIEPRGCLWLLENGRPARLIETGMTVVNGPAFSPDGGILYVSDSAARRIMAYDVVGKRVSGRRVFAEMTIEEGLPDGITVDAAGYVWCAHWGGGRVTRISPEGKCVQIVEIPAPKVTSVAFGGPELDTLFVTTARYGLSEMELERYPASGDLFQVIPGVRGIPSTPLPMPFRCPDLA
jgi:xylono-1,5-lactonase